MWGQMSGMGGFDPMMLQKLMGGAAPPQGGFVQQGIQQRPGGFSGLGVGMQQNPMSAGQGMIQRGAPMGMQQPNANPYGMQNPGMGNSGALGAMAEKLRGMTGGGQASPGGFGQFANPAAMADPRNQRARADRQY
jgi:hypothetical protein